MRVSRQVEEWLARPPWVGRQIVCPKCKRGLVLERKDKIHAKEGEEGKEGTMYGFECPECGADVRFR